MKDVCKNCGRNIEVMAFKGTDWCCENCRKALKGEIPCSYKSEYTDEVGEVQVCYVHWSTSNYPPSYGPHRPCQSAEEL